MFHKRYLGIDWCWGLLGVPQNLNPKVGFEGGLKDDEGTPHGSQGEINSHTRSLQDGAGLRLIVKETKSRGLTKRWEIWISDKRQEA